MTTYLTQQNSTQDFQCNPNKPCGITKSFPSRTLIHPKLELTQLGDSDEQEADAAANEVMSGKVCRKISGGGAGGGMAVSSQMESQLNHLQGGGQTLPAGLRDMMERGFDRDFSQVRLHTDSEAAGLSSSINAKAFTHGNDIYFNRGQFSPETLEGQRLVAHELAHVAQGEGKVGRKDGYEDEFKKFEDRIVELLSTVEGHKRYNSFPYELKIRIYQTLIKGNSRLLNYREFKKDIYKPFSGYIVSGYDFSNRFFRRLDDLGATIESNAKNLPRTAWKAVPITTLSKQSADTNEKVYESFSNSNMIVFSGHHYGRYTDSRHFGLFTNSNSSKTFSLASFQSYMEIDGKNLDNVEIVISTSCVTLCNNKYSNMRGYSRLFPNAKILGFRRPAPDNPIDKKGYLKMIFDEIEKKREFVNSAYIITLWKEQVVSSNGKNSQPGIWDVKSDTLEYYDNKKKEWIVINNASKLENNECAYHY